MVIVCDCKYRSALVAIRSFYKYDQDIIAVTTDKDPNPPAFSSKFVNCKYVFSSNPDKYKEQLLQLCNQLNMPIIFPSGNFTLNVLSENKNDFLKTARFIASSPSTLNKFNDKKWVKEQAKNHSINVPRLYSINDNITFPVVVKLFCGEKFNLKAKDRYKIAHNREELEKAYSYFLQFDNNILIEEYISGAGVGVSVLLDNNSTFVTCFCHKRLIEYPIDGGPSTCLETFYDQKLVESVKSFFESLRFCGIAMAEFKETENGYYLLEINPRVWGSFSATHKANSDYIVSYITASTAEKINVGSKYSINKKIKFFRGVCMSFLSYLKRGNIISSLKTFLVILNPFIPDATFSFTDFKASIKDLLRR